MRTPSWMPTWTVHVVDRIRRLWCRIFGHQWVVDECIRVCRRCPRLDVRPVGGRWSQAKDEP